MKQFSLFYLIIFSAIVISCSEEKNINIDPCECYEDKAFEYPPLPEGELESHWGESKTYWTIPDSILQCISTANLLETCLNYPNEFLLYTRGSLSDGIMVITNLCNGYEALFNREDFPQVLLEKYRNLHPNPYDNMHPAYMMNHSFLEVELLFGTACISGLSKEEKYELLQIGIDKTEAREELGYSPNGRIGGYTIMANIMLLEEYEPFVKEYNSYQHQFPGILSWLEGNFNNLHPIIMDYAKEYLNLVNSQK